ncbi:hypothetical protein GCM10010400_11010 [Streptomyces aculeolatus]|uniref:RNA polymerase sigma factor n=1 Tax=Streptomyces aculeolatus TaxID=270689 RepID=UPI001CEDF9E9|nr:sigma-70 family RNA polymerase sigma factor [Streptomyces aculeolatus]
MREPDDDVVRFTAMYDDFRQRVWAYAAARAGRQRADEVVSETFAVAWRRIGDVPEPPLPWLLGVARIQVRSGARAAAQRAAQEALLQPQAEVVTQDVADVVAERVTVLRALAELDPDDREVLVLVAWHDLDQRGAAEVLGCSPVAFRVRLHRARKRFARALEDVTHDARPAETPPVATPPARAGVGARPARARDSGTARARNAETARPRNTGTARIAGEDPR